ncbi:5-formyltetrahydrofolate cyclo-ligase [Orbaceae bacterium ac157xtp]
MQSSTTYIRQQARQLRRDLPVQQRLQAQSLILNKIKIHPKVALATNIAIFLSFDGEIDTNPIIDYLWQQKKQVYLPVINPKNKKQLLFLHYYNPNQLVKNSFGILEPKLDETFILPYTQLEVIFTPLVAFDNRNYRIGMGGGYYDRLLENYQQYHIYPIGLAFNCQQVPLIPNQPWDVPLAEIIHA